MGARQARPRVGEPSAPACQGRPHAATSYQCQRVHSTPCGDNAGHWRGSLSPQEPTWYHACQTLKPVCPSAFWVWDLGAQIPARCRGEVEGGHGVPGRTQEDQDLLWAAALGARDPPPTHSALLGKRSWAQSSPRCRVPPRLAPWCPRPAPLWATCTQPARQPVSVTEL